MDPQVNADDVMFASMRARYLESPAVVAARLREAARQPGGLDGVTPAHALVTAGRLLTDAGELGEAIATLRTAADLAPRDGDDHGARIALAIALALSGDSNAVEVLFRGGLSNRAARGFGQRVQAALALAEAGQEAEATRWAGAALEHAITRRLGGQAEGVARRLQSAVQTHAAQAAARRGGSRAAPAATDQDALPDPDVVSDPDAGLDAASVPGAASGPGAVPGLDAASGAGSVAGLASVPGLDSLPGLDSVPGLGTMPELDGAAGAMAVPAADPAAGRVPGAATDDPAGSVGSPGAADPEPADPGAAEPGGPVLWWPQSEYLRLARQLPGLAASIGPGWTGHLARTEALLRDRASGTPGPIALVAADFGHFATYLRKNGVDPRQPDVLISYTPAAARAGAVVAGAVVAWPPRPRRPCWCGSRRRYRDCCAVSGGAAVLAG